MSFVGVWLKRDLRLRDHAPLKAAYESGQRILLFYIVEPLMLNDAHMDERHWRFIYQSIDDLNKQLASKEAKILVLHGKAEDCISQLVHSGMQALYSYQEIGLAASYRRDVLLKKTCKTLNLTWRESPYGAVSRGLVNRLHWRQHWRHIMMQAVDDVPFEQLRFVNNRVLQLPEYCWPHAWKEDHPHFQKGGERLAWHTMRDFYKGRGKAYFGNIGKPIEARTACSRLSPYLTWGNISIKQVWQYSRHYGDQQGWRRSISAFQARLSWHCHFIQKFESESEMEFRPVNKAYLDYRYAHDDDGSPLLQAWKTGQTGIPLIDACMRAVIATGYLNFRMRAMLVSFLTHHLDVDWRLGVEYLGRQFLDFEPGIHYPQFQMQAGITGTNTIRLYNPVKQSKEKDPHGIFIKKWLPELTNLPEAWIHEPWKIPPIDAQLANFALGKDYPLPIVDPEESARNARKKLWTFRERKDVLDEAKRILLRHSVLN